jgi:nicotinate-nucleotide adenylyltransferase
MTKLCLGGAFNPIHHGHLLCARAAAEAIGATTVVLIPAHQSPFKKSVPNMASPAQRFDMCQIAVSGIGGFEVDDRELRRPPPSFTIDTVRDLRSEGWHSVSWLIGADQIPTLPNWHRAVELMNLAHLFVVARPGWQMDWSTLPEDFRHLSQRVVTVPLIDISSTDIRLRLSRNQPIDFLTPPPVCRYIADHGLYRS